MEPEPRALARSRRALLAWYQPRRRAFPWRKSGDPYRVLVSEVMLQQTQVTRVVPAYRAFVRRFPNVRALASASRRDVLVAWDGLGYNRRAVALSDAARAIFLEHSGRVPPEPDVLQGLPGVGPYTAAAVASIAFAVPVPAIDTNVRRIVARALLGTEAEEVSPSRIRELAQAWIAVRDPGAWNQALMDLGREVCRPRPRCDACPLAPTCRFRATEREPRPARRRQEPFEGSTRQLRGAVVSMLRDRRSASSEDLVAATGFEADRVREAIERLVDDGLVVHRRGRLLLAD